MWRDIKKILLKKKTFLLTTHINPDGDGMGAACALIELLRQHGKDVRFTCDSPIPSKFSFLDCHNLYENYDPSNSFDDIDVLIMVDTHRRDRIGRVAELIDRKGLITICIDHHMPTEQITPYLAIDEHACSAGSMVYTLFKEMGTELTREAAIGLYASVMCDTGRFCYSSTDRKAHKIAEECMKKGVDPVWMYAHLYRQVTVNEFRVYARALSRIEFYFDNKVMVQQICKDDYEALGDDLNEILHGDLEFIHDFNKVVVGVECIVLLREMPDGEVRLSLRSNSDLSIDQVTRALGGGGHAKAAGATVKGSLPDVKAAVISLLGELIHNYCNSVSVPLE